MYLDTAVRLFTSKQQIEKNLELYKVSQNPEDKEKLKEILSAVYSIMDKGTKKNIFHKNTAARKKAKLAAYLKNI